MSYCGEKDTEACSGDLGKKQERDLLLSVQATPLQCTAEL